MEMSVRDKHYKPYYSDLRWHGGPDELKRVGKVDKNDPDIDWKLVKNWPDNPDDIMEYLRKQKYKK